MRVRRGNKNQKSLKKSEKKGILPLEKEKLLMYNSPVVCLGMKW